MGEGYDHGWDFEEGLLQTLIMSQMRGSLI